MISNSRIIRALMVLAALLCLALGIVGVFVPGLPTTVFIILAAWFAAKGSPRLLAWLENHRLFGAMIRDWRLHGAVSRRAKWSASIAMVLSILLLFLIKQPLWILELASFCMLVVAIWLWRRPETPGAPPPKELER